MEYPAKELMGYLCKALCSPLRTLRYDLVSAPEKIFSEPNTHIHKPTLREWVRRDWISDKTWASIGARVTARRWETQKTIRRLSR